MVLPMRVVVTRALHTAALPKSMRLAMVRLASVVAECRSGVEMAGSAVPIGRMAVRLAMVRQASVVAECPSGVEMTGSAVPSESMEVELSAVNVTEDLQKGVDLGEKVCLVAHSRVGCRVEADSECPS